MTLIRPTPEVSGSPRRGGGRRRSAGMLVLVGLGALIPLLGPGVAARGTGEATGGVSGATGLLRTVLFCALCVAAGEVWVRWLTSRIPGAPTARARDWTLPAGCAGFAAAVGLAAGAPSGSWEGVLGEVEAVGFLVVGVRGVAAPPEGRTGRRISRSGRRLTALSERPARQLWPLGLVVVAEALRAHPPGERMAVVGAVLTIVHLVCAAMWAGGLLMVVRTLRRWGGSPCGAALLGVYARVAAFLLAGVSATGMCSSLRRVPAEVLLSSAYGRVLLAKVVLVAGVALVALVARGRLRRAADPLTACAPARVEVVLLGFVVAVSGLLTVVPVP